jgi:hypothetical protein
MKIKMTYTKVYDYEEIKGEFVDSMQDHRLTLEALTEFIYDRFINMQMVDTLGGEATFTIFEEGEAVVGPPVVDDYGYERDDD